MTTKTERARPVLALAIATSLGVGYLPLAPGTWGSAVGVALVAGVAAATRAESAPLPLNRGIHSDARARGHRPVGR